MESRARPATCSNGRSTGTRRTGGDFGDPALERTAYRGTAGTPRAAQAHDFVARAISGHATVETQQLYSSVDGAEVRSGLAKVISLAGFRQAKEAEARSPVVVMQVVIGRKEA